MLDHLFPRFHVRPPYGYMNDPNGPIVVDGTAHLYFQYRHSLDLRTPVLWGHVTSPDLVHWDYQRPAMAPHPGLGDREGCFSGNTVVDDTGRVRAFYSGFIRDEPLQRTLCAISTDGGYAFGAPREVVPAPHASEAIQQLRDPFVWRTDAGWRLVVGAEGPGELAMVRLYESSDLDSWTYRGVLAQMHRARTPEWESGVMWECPQVVTLDGGDVVLIGAWEPELGVTRVLSFVAPRPSERPELTPSDLSLVDHGPNFYAASVLRDGASGPLVWGWATEGRSGEWCAEDGWSGMLTLPRSVSLRPDGSLASAPVPEMASLRTAPEGRPVPDVADDLPAQFEFLLELGGVAEEMCSVRLAFGDAEQLTVSIDRAAGTVTVDRSHASSDPRADGGVATVVAGGLAAPGATLRGFVDGSIMELFLSTGEVVTTRFYPTSPPPWRLELSGGAPGAQLTVWPLADRMAIG